MAYGSRALLSMDLMCHLGLRLTPPRTSCWVHPLQAPSNQLTYPWPESGGRVPSFSCQRQSGHQSFTLQKASFCGFWIDPSPLLTPNWLWRHWSTEGSHLGALQAEVLKTWEAQGGRGGGASNVICYPCENNVIMLRVLVKALPFQTTGSTAWMWPDWSFSKTGVMVASCNSSRPQNSKLTNEV